MISFSLAMPAWSAELRLKQSRNVRMRNGNNVEYIAQLKENSIIEIPEKYVIRDNATQNVLEDLTLTNWLEQAQVDGSTDQPGVYTYDRNKKEYFFPVKVKKAIVNSEAKQVRKVEDGETVYISLGKLKVGDGQLKLRGYAPIFGTIRDRKVKTAIDHVQELKPEEILPAEKLTADRAGTPCKECSSAGNLTNLIADLRRPLTAIMKRNMSAVNSGKKVAGNLRQRFEKSCGMNFDSFLSELDKACNAAGVPREIMLSIMIQESHGNCQAGDGRGSIGIFQVNLRSTSLRGSLQEKARKLKDPRVNLYEAVRIVQMKRNALINAGFRLTSENDPSGLESWRPVLAAYNGGEKYVVDAKNDLLAFNRAHGSRYNFNHWEHLRIFMLRNWLTSGDDAKHFSSRRRGFRSQNNSIINVSYVDTIVGRQEYDANGRPWPRNPSIYDAVVGKTF